jgi:hypothetical protein
MELSGGGGRKGQLTGALGLSRLILAWLASTCSLWAASIGKVLLWLLFWKLLMPLSVVMATSWPCFDTVASLRNG